MSIYHHLLFYFIVCLNASFLIGYFIRKVFSKTTSTWLEFFYSLALGWFVVSSAIAMIYSGLTTSLTIPFILFLGYTLFYFSQNKREEIIAITQNFHFNRLLVINAIGVIIYSVNWILICGFTFEKAIYPKGDLAFYTRLSDFLVEKGYETTTIDYFYTTIRQKIPYHYIEHWFSGGVSEIFKISTVQSYIIVMIPLLLSILYIGFVNILDNRNEKRSSTKFILAFLALFVSGFAFLYPNFIPILQVYIHDFSALRYFKLLPAYILILCVLFELEGKNYHRAIVLIVANGMIYGSTLPASLCIASGMWIYVTFIDNKSRGVLSGLPTLVIILTSTALFALYYSSQPDQSVGNPHFADFQTSDILNYLKTSTNILIKLPFAILIVLLPYLLFSIYMIRKSKAAISPSELKPFYFMIIAALLAVVPYAMLHSIPNAHQLYRSMYFICGNLGAIWLLSFGYKSKVKSLRIVAVLFLLINPIIHPTYRLAEYIEPLKTGEFKNVQDIFAHSNGRYLYFRYSPENTMYYASDLNVYTPSNYLQLIFSPLVFTCGNPEILLIEPITDFRSSLEAQIDESPINLLHLKLYQRSIYEEKNDSIYIQFIQRENIDGIIAPNGYQIPETLKKYIGSAYSIPDGKKLYLIRELCARVDTLNKFPHFQEL